MTKRALIYTHPNSLLDTKRYDLTSSYPWRNDPVANMTLADVSALAASPHWEDRIRAAELVHSLRPTLPDQFPVLYERHDSPNNNRDGKVNPHAREFNWVAHPVIDVLHDTLDAYQAIWDRYTDQWGPSARRVFAVGLRDGVSAHGVFTPEARTQDILSQAILTHGMLGVQPPETVAAHRAWVEAAREANR